MTVGLEAINFQSSSKLGSRLTTLFETGFNFLKTYDSKNDIAGITNTSARHDALLDHFNNEMVPEFTDIVLAETGIIINKVVAIHPSRACGLFAVDLSMNTPDAMQEVGNMMIGYKSYKDVKKTNDLEELLTMCELFDAKAGRVTSNTFGKGKKITVDLYFDVGTAFLSNELLPNVPALMPDEIAAIMMHELGHVLCLVEHSGNLIYLGQAMHDTKMHLSKNGDPLEMIPKFKDRLLGLIASFEKSSVLGAKVGKMLSTAVVNLANAATNASRSTSLFPSMFILLLGSVFGLVLTVIFGLFIMSILVFTHMIQGAIKSTKLESIRGKSSEDTFTDRNLAYFERIADEFVVRHGMGSYLATGLQKIIKFGNTLKSTSGAKVLSCDLHDSTTIKLYLSVTSYFTRIFSFNVGSISTSYESDLARMERLLQSNLGVFKNRNISPNVADRYIHETMKLMQVIKAEKRNTAATLDKFLWTYVVPLSLPSFLIDVLATGRLGKDMEKLLDTVDNLTNNKLYYQSARLARLG